jgi:hypothetical protein
MLRQLFGIPSNDTAPSSDHPVQNEAHESFPSTPRGGESLPAQDITDEVSAALVAFRNKLEENDTRNSEAAQAFIQHLQEKATLKTPDTRNGLQAVDVEVVKELFNIQRTDYNKCSEDVLAMSIEGWTGYVVDSTPNQSISVSNAQSGLAEC